MKRITALHFSRVRLFQSFLILSWNHTMAEILHTKAQNDRNTGIQSSQPEIVHIIRILETATLDFLCRAKEFLSSCLQEKDWDKFFVEMVFNSKGERRILTKDLNYWHQSTRGSVISLYQVCQWLSPEKYLSRCTWTEQNFHSFKYRCLVITTLLKLLSLKFMGLFPLK